MCNPFPREWGALNLQWILNSPQHCQAQVREGSWLRAQVVPDPRGDLRGLLLPGRVCDSLNEVLKRVFCACPNVQGLEHWDSGRCPCTGWALGSQIIPGLPDPLAAPRILWVRLSLCIVGSVDTDQCFPINQNPLDHARAAPCNVSDRELVSPSLPSRLSLHGDTGDKAITYRCCSPPPPGPPAMPWE